MKKLKLIDKLKQRRKKKGFTLVELVVVILIIAILASATFLGGATVIKQARKTKATNDLRNYSSYLEDMFYNHPNYASKGITSGKVVESLNEYLTADLAVKAGVDESKGTSVELKDAWDNAYNYAYYRNSSATEAAVLVWSNGPDQVSGSSLTSIEPTIVGDDIAVLVKMVNGEVSTLTSDSLTSDETGGESTPAAPTWSKVDLGGGNVIANDASNTGFENLRNISSEIAKNTSITAEEIENTYGIKVGNAITVDGLICYIAGFNHDTANGETGITFIGKYTSNHAMNVSYSNAGGYSASGMYTYLNETVLQDVLNKTGLTNEDLKTVKKMSDEGYGNITIKTTEDKLWLLSYEEVFPTDYANYTSDKDYVVFGQGSCYPIFTAENSSRTQISSSVWWLRSAFTNGSNFFWSVNGNGYGNTNSAGATIGVVFGFCV